MVSAPAFSYPLDSPGELQSGTIEGNISHELYNGKDYNYVRSEADAPFISGSTGLDTLLFTSVAGHDEAMLIFTGGNTQAFYEIHNLGFKNLSRLKFKSMSSGVIYSEGNRAVTSTLEISGIKDNTAEDDVYFFGNSNTGNCGGAINASYTAITISDNGGVIFEGNKASAASGSNENQNQTSTGGGGVSVGHKYSLSLFGLDLSFEFGFGFGFSYTYDNPATPEVEPSIDICGGAINIVDSSLTMNGNEGVTFTKNRTADYGGAISASPGTMSSVIINENGKVLFQENVTTGHVQDGYVAGGGGGAIFIGKQGSLQMYKNTGDIIFTQNMAAAAGGAIYHGGQNLGAQDKSLSWVGNTGNISFVDNVAMGTGGAIHMVTGGILEMAENTGVIIFEKNKAGVSGGAISALDAFVTMYDNTSIIFRDNIVFHQDIHSKETDSFSSFYVGGAIYGTDIQIHNNGSVLFERNAEIVEENFFRLRSLYVDGSYDKYLEGPSAYPPVSVSLSAGEEQFIEFRDSIYIKGANLNLNSSYADTPQTGDIIFTGKTTVEDLEKVKQDWRVYGLAENVSLDVTEAEILASRTSIVLGETHLNGGRLRVEKGAIFKSAGISLAEDSNSTLRVDDATLVNINTSAATSSATSINVGRGTTLEVFGHSTIEGGQLNFADGARWSFDLNETHMAGDVKAVALTFSGQLNIDGGLTINLNLSNADMMHRYVLYRGDTPDQWTAGNITVSGTGDAAGACFDDLVWEGNTLLYVSSLVWSNAQGTGAWGKDDKNWQNDKTFKHGMIVKFTDEGAGTVTLTGAMAPDSIIVSNSKGKDYTFAGQKIDGEEVGKLTYRSNLEKRGDGALTIETANDHEGTTTLKEGTLNLHNGAALGNTTLMTDDGTTLGVGGGADVKLKDKAHIIKGNVMVAEGSSLEIANDCSYKASSTSVDGKLIFSEHAMELGSLSGNGLLEVRNGVNVQFQGDASAFKGKIAVTGSSSSLFLNVLDGMVRAGEVAVSAGNLYLNAQNQLTMAGGSILSMVAGKVAESVSTVIANKLLEFAQDAILSAMLQSMMDADGDGILNEGLGGQITGAGLTLHAGSTLHLENSHIHLDSGDAGSTTLTLNVTPEDAEKINLVLLLDDFLTADSMVLLFSGVDNVVFEYDNASVEGGGIHEWAASHYFSGNLVGENTMLVYDGDNRIVYLTGLVPEPATATLSLLALVAMAARRRR